MLKGNTREIISQSSFRWLTHSGQYLSTSLMGQTFAGRKELLVTTDRLPWHGGIQKHDIMTILSYYDIGDQQEMVMLFVLFAYN